MSGFGLVEALISLLILSIVIGFSAKTLSDKFTAIRLEQSAANLQLGMMAARAEAIKRNARVVICKSLDGSNCDEHGNWESGWIIFPDADNSGTRSFNEELIRIHLEPDLASSISGNTNVKNYVSFSALGTAKLVSGGFQAGTFTVCPRRLEGAQARQVILNSMGRVRIANAPLSVCTNPD